MLQAPANIVRAQALHLASKAAQASIVRAQAAQLQADHQRLAETKRLPLHVPFKYQVHPDGTISRC